MKKLIVSLLLILTLTGCASLKNGIANFWMAKWDSNEAMLVSRASVAAQSSLITCDPRFSSEQRLANAASLNTIAHQLLSYSKTLPDDNTPVIIIMKNIQDSTNEFYTKAQDTMSKVYCENKTKNIIVMVEQATTAVQSKRK